MAGPTADGAAQFWPQQVMLSGIEYAVQGGNKSTGNDPTKRSSSAAALFATLIPVVAVAAASLLGFFFLRRTHKHLYAPRTYLATLDEAERSPLSKDGWFDWIPSFLKLKDESLLEKQSLDAYLFLRFFKMIILICFFGVCLTWPILFPVNVTGGGKSKELDRLTIGNVKDPNRYYAHLFVSWIFLTFVMFIITRETLYFINLRQAYLLTPWNASRISSRTVLLTSVPRRNLNEEYLRKAFESVKRVWIIYDAASAEKLVAKRDSCAKTLEAQAVKAIQNQVKSKGKRNGIPKVTLSPDNDGRPRTRALTLVGNQGDAIRLYSQQLLHLEQEAESAQHAAANGDSQTTGAVFIEFETISAAQAAIQSTANQAPFVMTPRSVATVPADIAWENISIPAWEVVLRGLLATAFIVALVLLWAIPTSFIGVLSNISDIADRFKWLHWINNLPRPILGAIEGLLPSFLLSYLVSLVPMICRYVARKAGEVTTAQIELKTQEWYFVFQVVQVFLVTTFASGATAVTSDIISDPKSAPELLAKKLPKASNFYLSYFIIYGFGQSTKNLMNWSGLFFDKLYGFLNNTPREKYQSYVSLSGTGWGSWYPKFTNLAILAISYSTIAPLTLGFATIAFSLLYLVFRYNLFYVLRTSIDTQGRAYAKALQQLTVGVYTAEFCLIGLFSISAKRGHGSSGPLVLMVIFTILTVIYHRIMHKQLNVLTKTLPSNLVREQEAIQDAEAAGEDDPLLGSKPREVPSGLNGLFLRFFEPQKYASFRSNLEMLERTRLGEVVPAMPDEKEENAYQHPALTSKIPKLWIARDEAGVASKKLIEELSKDFEVTDEGATVNGKGKVEIDKENLRSLPVWKDKLYY